MNFFWIYFSLIVLIGCSNSNDGIKQLKTKYSSKDINAFYERNLNSEFAGPYLFKWSGVIAYKIVGDTSFSNKIDVYNAIDQYNNLNLPIRFHETKDKNSANLTISFGANLLKTSTYCPGASQTTGVNGKYNKSIIEVRNEEK